MDNDGSGLEGDIVISDDGRRLRPVKSLMRAIDLIEALAAGGRPLGVTELAAAIGSSKTAAYNMITTLEYRGLITKDGNNRYWLGWGLFELGEMVHGASVLGDAARPHLEVLAETTGETALVGILDHGSVIYLEKAESRRSIRMVESPGQRQPLHATTAGLLLLAFAPPEYRRRYLTTPSSDDHPAGINAAALQSSLDAIVSDGYAVSFRDPEPDLNSVSVPIFGAGEQVVAALMLAGPSSRLTDKRVRQYLPALLGAAAVVGRAVGARTNS